MKVLIVSDTHGSHRTLDDVLESVGDIDMFIHLGDVEGGEEYIEKAVNCEKHIVRGNNDFFSSLNPEEEFMIGDLKAFITHGHNYYVSLDPEQIKAEGRARGAKVVMFGHTHRPFLDEDEDIVVLNPGSLSYPRQAGREPSYMVMEIAGNGVITYSQRFVKK